MFSYNGHMHFGLLADRETVDDLDAIAGYIDESSRSCSTSPGRRLGLRASPQLV